jgi:hypothetical protein
MFFIQGGHRTFSHNALSPHSHRDLGMVKDARTAPPQKCCKSPGSKRRVPLGKTPPKVSGQ